MIVVCLGLPRSGSTLHFNIVRMLAEQNGWDVLEWTKNDELMDVVKERLLANPTAIVFKTHTIPDGLLELKLPIKVLTTYRDFRDVAASNKVAFDNSVDKTIKVLRRSLIDIDVLKNQGIPIYVGTYNVFKDDIEDEARLVGEFLDLTVSNEVAETIQNACNVDKAYAASTSAKSGRFQTLKRRISLFFGVAPYKDKNLRLHHNHVSSRMGKANYYSDVLTHDEIARVESELGEAGKILTTQK